MGKNHVFIIARDLNTRLRVPCSVRKYGAKKEHGAENVYPTREACASAIVQDEVFEYQSRAKGNLLVRLEDIRKHCKMLGGNEVDREGFECALRRSELQRKDFKRVLDMGDVLVSNFNMFFWICDCGMDELWVYEPDCRVIEEIGSVHSIDIMPSGNFQPVITGVVGVDFGVPGGDFSARIEYNGDEIQKVVRDFHIPNQVKGELVRNNKPLTLQKTWEHTTYNFSIEGNFLHICTLVWDGITYKASIFGRFGFTPEPQLRMEDAIFETLKYLGMPEAEAINLTVDLTRKFLKLGEANGIGNFTKVNT